MKLFNTVQELWDHCLFCQICQKNSRHVKVNVGPDPSFTNILFQKSDDKLSIVCLHKSKYGTYNVEFRINCINNTFEYFDLPGGPASKSLPYFYFWLGSDCQNCGDAFTYSSDLELLDVNEKITSISLERESFVVHSGKSELHITSIHDGADDLSKSGIMLVSSSEYKNAITLPIVSLDFSNQEKVFNKIKTLIIFS